ncbi:hypothetical protein NQ317_008147 [Molorchus minor]|uniref:U6 small nuclear RNA (adenine-(43)-N(6))-methyltransferase n=1 Tax=Molorchus minor TaxID=1323400 RepID=A0ABQ9JIR9_9CUCU|nr:hypothetical protein NQ317_008147 [Molorchus minor]
MSMNKYMHPRNIYKSPPNFKELALEFPEFRPFVRPDLNGKITLDFKDVHALRALSCVLLKKDFGLIVEMPMNKLIPTIPLRLNYILWIEDLLKAATSENIVGIDIGTGASCIYPLLAAKKNKWAMLATENDSNSFSDARNNVERNKLQDLIRVVLVKQDKLLEGVIEDREYDFCISRKAGRPHPKNAFCASVNEVVAKGGEVEFITRLIDESKNINRRIKVYSTMIGQKSSLPPLKKALREASVTSFNESYFCQGNTTRWGLAWTFCTDINLKKVLDPVKQISRSNKTKGPLIYPIGLASANKYSLSDFSERLLRLFKELDMAVEEASRNPKVLRYFVTAFANTWSHQRRRKREKRNKSTEGCINCKTNMDLDESSNSLPLEKSDTSGESNNNMENPVKSPGKRTQDDTFEGTCIKKLKISVQDGEAEAAVFFKFTATLRLDEDIYLELNCEENSENREHLHQVLQYLKK